MSDEKGVLGNLPRSRPGRRSDKRATTSSRPAKAAERAAKASEGDLPKAPAAGRSSAAPKAAGSARRTTSPKVKPAPRNGPPPPERAVPTHSDPLADAVRVASKVAGAGARVGVGLAQEVLRRLPRP